VRLRRGVIQFGLIAMLSSLSFPIEAQQPKRVPRIGYLSAQDLARASTGSEAIRLALRELGYIEGQTIAIEYRYAAGKRDRLPELAGELVRLKVDVLVLRSLSSIRAAKQATQTIPIVMVTSLDPVATGIKLSFPLSHFGHLRFAYCGTDIGEAKQLPS
jgi:putative tryptophan/tyrosine transport system substrate-binding protein